MAEPESKYSEEAMKGDGVSKKDIASFLQENGSNAFLSERKLMGKVANVAKTKTKDDLVKAYMELFETKSFRSSDEVEMAAAGAAAKVEEATKRVAKVSLSEETSQEVKYTKKVLKKGNDHRPSKGDIVSVWYTGKFEDGTVFDTNTTAPKRFKKPELFRFKVGYGKVIRGWDEGVLTMGIGEKAEFTIEPEWAYGRKGVEGKIPPNSRLIFAVELVTYE